MLAESRVQVVAKEENTAESNLGKTSGKWLKQSLKSLGFNPTMNAEVRKGSAIFLRKAVMFKGFCC